MESKLRIVAVTKTFRGEEWAVDSLSSIYPYCSRIVYVHSDIAWNGDKGNTVRELVRGFADPCDKIVHLDREGDQNDQYNAAIQWLFENEVRYDYLMLIDTDEVWSDEDWKKSLPILEANLEENEPAMAIRTQMYDYIKSPFFRVDPPAPLKPVVFVHRDAVKLNAINVRGMTLTPYKILDNVYFHHFCSVRKSFSDVWHKHTTSCGIESEPIVEKKSWVTNIWNRLPHARNCLPLQRYCSNWESIKCVTVNDLPKAVHENPIVKAWLAYPDLVCTINSELLFEALKMVGLPLDFSPSHPDWNMASKQAKYRKALELAAA